MNETTFLYFGKIEKKSTKLISMARNLIVRPVMNYLHLDMFKIDLMIDIYPTLKSNSTSN